MTISPETIAELKRLDAAATQKEWCVSGVGLRALVRNGKGEIVASRHRASAHDNEHDMALIAAARNHLRELIEWGEGLKRKLSDAETARDEISRIGGKSLADCIRGLGNTVSLQASELASLRRTVAEKDEAITTLEQQLAHTERELENAQVNALSR